MKKLVTLSEKDRKERIFIITLFTCFAVKYVYPVLKGFIIDLF